jgi:hypothetical protein
MVLVLWLPARIPFFAFQLRVVAMVLALLLCLVLRIATTSFCHGARALAACACPALRIPATSFCTGACALVDI